MLLEMLRITFGLCVGYWMVSALYGWTLVRSLSHVLDIKIAIKRGSIVQANSNSGPNWNGEVSESVHYAEIVKAIGRLLSLPIVPFFLGKSFFKVITDLTETFITTGPLTCGTMSFVWSSWQYLKIGVSWSLSYILTVSWDREELFCFGTCFVARSFLMDR